jgi:N-dimethylarginine dimethylaminohydrolase
MCPPDHYGIEYEINPWMNRSLGAVRELAFTQWRNLHTALTGLGVTVETLAPVPGLPDLVFTANAGLVYRDTFLSSRFRHDVRAKESPVFDAWFAAHGFDVEHLPETAFHEGAGDALFCGDILFAGYRIRSDAVAHQWVGQKLGVRVLPLELVNPRFYHLDTCFCPLEGGYAMYYPPAFDEASRAAIEKHVPAAKRIAIHEEDALAFACNAVNIDDKVVVNRATPAFVKALGAKGLEVVQTPLSEFMKAGGSAKCLTLRLDEP